MLAARAACCARGLTGSASGRARKQHTFRHCPLSGDWVVYGSARKNRPKQTSHEVEKVFRRDLTEHVASCPFCGGNEEMTPNSLLTYAGKESNEWLLRVVPNKFPVVSSMAAHAAEDARRNQLLMARLFEDDNPTNNEIGATGFHEVVIESPKHNACMSSGPVEMTHRVVRAWRERGGYLRGLPGVKHVHYFKNSGGAAGASLVHPHSQVVALPIVSNLVYSRVSTTRDFFVRQGKNVFKELVDRESAAGERVVDECDDFLALVPHVARSPYEMLILPKRQQAHFENIEDAQLRAFGTILHRALRRLDATLDEPSFNIVLRTAPFFSRNAYDYELFFSWHCCIYPRFGAGELAGFEFGTGVYSNSHLPENDAKELRNCMV